jgi:hypothetical protein
MKRLFTLCDHQYSLSYLSLCTRFFPRSIVTLQSLHVSLCTTWSCPSTMLDQHNALTSDHDRIKKLRQRKRRSSFLDAEVISSVWTRIDGLSSWGGLSLFACFIFWRSAKERVYTKWWVVRGLLQTDGVLWISFYSRQFQMCLILFRFFDYCLRNRCDFASIQRKTLSQRGAIAR